MPIYEYRCAECGLTFSLLRPMSQSNAEATCPHCTATNTRRLVSSFAAVGAGAECGPIG
jgi:putative FmdB family regulatory protein